MTKTILITGCSSGIGHDAAHTLAKRGWRVLATCRKPADVARLQAEGLESFTLDCADADSIAAGWDRAMDLTGGTLDAIFNNAGHGLPGLIEDVPVDGLREIFETNVFGLHDLTRRAVAVMRAQGGYGRIVQHSSGFGRIAMGWRGAYVATKFAVEGLSDTYRMELRGTNIKVSILNTGPITTRFRANSVAPFEKWIDWEASADPDRYRKHLLRHLHKDTGPAPSQRDPAYVTRRVIHAVESPRPRARYIITTASHVAEIGRRLLPQATQDWLLTKF
jgi:NAD(P)-dependent dehydrogenase (short-subunit alcohol dehydrogenase family)